MRLTALLFLLALSAAQVAVAQQPASIRPELAGIERITRYMGLRPEDLSFRADFTEPDSFRLATVSRLMTSPLEMIDYTDQLRAAHVVGQPEILPRILFADLSRDGQAARGRPYAPPVEDEAGHYMMYYTDLELNRLLIRTARHLDLVLPGSARLSLQALSPAQRAFLNNEFIELIVMREEEEHYSVDQLDSLERAEEEYCERFVEFGHLIDPDPIVAAGIDCLRDVVLEASNLRRLITSGLKDPKGLLAGSGPTPKAGIDTGYVGFQNGWKVGGVGTDYYEGDYQFILDLGGDDFYNLSYDINNPHGVIIIDLDGNDCYRADDAFAIASGCYSAGILLDYGGNDRYDAGSFGLGSGFFGLGVLYDASGNDRYNGDTHVQGAASLGMGLLIDEGGRDIYDAALYAQGFGFLRGIGAVFDLTGSDSYYAGGKYKDILRYEDHYLSLSQGFGYGLRPFTSGGIGIIVDMQGNDSYNSDIFGQGTSYWWSLGVLYDSSGNDNYQSFQYAQGTGVHLSLGVLVDDLGQDVYFGKGLVQGCGHDYACGIIVDRAGNDTYTASDLSQGGGSANGAGIQIDLQGDDRYFAKRYDMTQGYGNPRREFGSIGLFLDLGGDDQYAGNGRDSAYWRSASKWGAGMDIEMNSPDSATEARR